MAMKVTVGLSRKVGQPNFGSAGASCHIDVELDQSLLDGDQRHLHERLRQALGVCRQVVERELTGDEPPRGYPEDLAFAPSAPSVARPGRPASGTGTPPIGERSGGGGGEGGSQRWATPAQIKALQVIAGKGGVALSGELQRHFGVRHPQELTLRQASQMIDRLKAALTPQPA